MTDDTIRLQTPQFERSEDAPDPSDPPETPEDWERLRDEDVDDLLERGLRKWDGDGLLLFPGEWFDHIPEGFEVTTINGETRPFDPEQESRDIRFGCLAFGVEVDDGDE